MYHITGYYTHVLYNSFLYTEGTDFVLDTTEIEFPAMSGNGVTMDVMVTPTDDMLVEGIESYILSIAAVTSGQATIGTMVSVSVNIEDNDGKVYFLKLQPHYQLAASNSAINNLGTTVFY